VNFLAPLFIASGGNVSRDAVLHAKDAEASVGALPFSGSNGNGDFSADPQVADWYGRTILHSLWGIPLERFTSQAFWDAFEKILPDHLDPLATGEDDPLDHAQLRCLERGCAIPLSCKELMGMTGRLLGDF